MSSTARLTHQRVRLYEVIRTAHLERARELAPASIVYRTERYDFDPSVAPEVELVKAGPVAAARLLARSGVTTIEVNEPLQLSAAPATLLTLWSLGAGTLFGGTRPLVVSYAIENLDPSGFRPARLRSRAKRRVQRWCAERVWRRLDRIVYGTHGAKSLYESALSSRPGLDAAVVEALPAPFPSRTGVERDQHQVVFLGALSDRKGFPLLAEAWPLLAAAHPGARLVILGTGALEPLATTLAAADPSVTVHIDPARSVIFDVLAGSRVLVLPSQPRPAWREQVGLPIVEALASGCLVVTTSETGIAAWLADHGHTVVDPDLSAQELADAIGTTLASTTRSQDVLDDLPDTDGRLAADARMFATTAGAR
ncbi:glycosyltransferase family 4 protein [Plantibacter sp. Mn2098]|uniref:glycosyltransferase family 4 protein n=1 Tax=Plantibacter sp. Mn2098 TaxID=3395266 RepID=UPI003BE21C26